MEKNKYIIVSFLLLTLFLLIQGCVGAISRDVRRGINREITFKKVLSDPDAFVERKVLWGGKIISTENLKEGSLIEVIQVSLDFTDRPGEISSSRGRFLIQTPQFLDKEVYIKGKGLTVAGIVKGRKVKPIGELEYPYPVIEPLEIKLWEPVLESKYPDYSPFYYDPFYYDPFFYDPFFSYPRRYSIYPAWHPPHDDCLYWHPPAYDINC
ncbi:MAG: Slp family lipoprotein [Thermodesulfobacteriota bacterium]